MNLSVIGCGYLGATHAACLAELGFDVVGVESSSRRLADLSSGTLPFFEPGLEEMITRHVASGRLRFTGDPAEAASFATSHFICVGTPQQVDSDAADLSQVWGAVKALAPHVDGSHLLIGKSTVPAGTAEKIRSFLTTKARPGSGSGAAVAWNPEFLREGFAIEDTLRPDRLVFGIDEPSAEETLRAIFANPISAGTPVVVTDLATAELAKTSANAFLATKISFINAVADVCESAGADVSDLAEILGYDKRIGRSFLNAGVGFGGGCLPKDIRSFGHRAGELGATGIVSLLRDVDLINLGRREKVVAMVTSKVDDIRGSRVAVLGAAFKPNSDDIRDSPALSVAGELQLRGALVCVYDPKAMPNASEKFPTISYKPSAEDACRDADVVLLLTEWDEFRAIDPAALRGLVRTPVIIDGRNALDATLWRAEGWQYLSIGRA